ncbi:Adenylate cyclase-inhibiting G alpha protein [Intoshia linei]|uniref:Adenylate cyclase-inhibiting G alpha protein n=1 Tax=Intoshia linei TaxID=1819745 RepID=A0A177AZV9_9BILA|nr:Adenylate cyclase-inhibiting G alpha protein [Intoshia linei]
MGCPFSRRSEQSRLKSKKIDKQLEYEIKKGSRDVKLLLLGAGESGKSTIIKQIKIIHDTGYTEKELCMYRPIVFNNLCMSMITVVRAMGELNVHFEHPSRLGDVELLFNESRSIESVEFLSSDLRNAMLRLWQDKGLRDCFEKSAQYQLNDSAEYYFNSIDRIGQENYLPTINDILRTRVKTTGIVEIKFTYNDLNFRLFDVGGQRSERKKWIHCFEGVSAILFIAALNEYDMYLAEDRHTNRMTESLSLFNSIIKNKWFHETALILFLNKIDLLKEKYQKSPIKTFYENYNGTTFDDATEFFTNMFLELRDKQNTRKQIYVHLTCATDTKNIEFKQNTYLFYRFSILKMWKINEMIQNKIMNYSKIEIKLRETTNDEAKHPLPEMMHEIAQYTFVADNVLDIINALMWRIGEDQTRWRRIYKTLILTEYLIGNGSDTFIKQIREKISSFEYLKGYRQLDIHKKDQGINVRTKAVKLVNLLKSNSQIREERIRAKQLRKKLYDSKSQSSYNKNSFQGVSNNIPTERMTHTGNESFMEKAFDIFNWAKDSISYSMVADIKNRNMHQKHANEYSRKTCRQNNFIPETLENNVVNNENDEFSEFVTNRENKDEIKSESDMFSDFQSSKEETCTIEPVNQGKDLLNYDNETSNNLFDNFVEPEKNQNKFNDVNLMQEKNEINLFDVNCDHLKNDKIECLTPNNTMERKKKESIAKISQNREFIQTLNNQSFDSLKEMVFN